MVTGEGRDDAARLSSSFVTAVRKSSCITDHHGSRLVLSSEIEREHMSNRKAWGRIPVFLLDLEETLNIH